MRKPSSVLDIPAWLQSQGQGGLEWGEDWVQEWARLSASVPPEGPRPRLYVQAWSRPPRAGGDWIPDLLVRAGALPFLTPPGSRDLDVSWEEIMEFDPQMVVLCEPGLGRDRDPAEWLAIEGWDRVEAAAQGRILSLDDRLLHTPGPGLLEGGRLLQGLLREAFWGGPRVAHPGLRRLAGKD